jgi:hypothetical protein
VVFQAEVLQNHILGGSCLITEFIENSIEPVAKVGYFCTALAVSQAKALRNMHF